jgi:anti-sigma regulatory factor (Ser/Thr protein kinase)
MGVMQTPRYSQRTVVVKPGSTLLLYTDGLVERSTEVLDVGLERLREAAVAGADVEALCARVAGAMADPGTAQDDDVTMIAMHALATLDERVALKVAGDPGALSSTRDMVRRWLSEAGADEVEKHDITMACNEACQNAIEHAYGLGADLFDVVLERTGADVAITVRDQGSWKSTTSPDRGRGIELMRELMDGVDVDGGEMGSTIALRRRLRSPSARPAVAGAAS